MFILIDIGAFDSNLIKTIEQGKEYRYIRRRYSKYLLSAGLALSGIVPTVYGITPFIAQRSLEQLKLDYIYQNVGMVIFNYGCGV